MKTFRLAFVSTVIAGALVAAQTPPPVPVPAPPARPATPALPQGMPARDPGSAPQYGKASISGTVTTLESPSQPLRRAIVTINGGGLRSSRQTVTDTQGRYLITELPSGSFSISVSKPSFVALNYGAKQLGQPSSPLTVAEGQQATADLKMVKGAVISGTVTDRYGRPQQGQVQIWKYQTSGGQRRLNQVGSYSIDDRGIYRAFGFSPGDYVIAAQPYNGQDVRQVTDEEVRWAGQPDTRSNISNAPATPPPAPGPTVGLAPIYFPGTPEVTGATVITLAAGEERLGLDFQMPPVPTAKVEGTVVDPDGRVPQSPQVNLFASDHLASPQSIPMLQQLYGRVDGQTGKFTFTGVPPGHYVLFARSTIRSAPPVPPPAPVPAGGAVPGPVPMAAQPPQVLWAMGQVDVAGRDVSGITVPLQAGLSISGRVAFEASQLALPQDLSRVRVSMSAMDPGPLNMSVPAATATKDGTFELKGAIPGKYRMSVSSPPSSPPPSAQPAGAAATPGATSTPVASPMPMQMQMQGPDFQRPQWVLKSIRANGVEVLDAGLELGMGSITDVVATFTDKMTELTGTLMDAAGAPVKDLSVLLFSTDRTYWTPQSRRTRITRPNQDGKFRFSPWPPGEYFLVAVMDPDSIDLTDANGLQQFAAVAMKITLAEGERKNQDVRVAK